MEKVGQVGVCLLCVCVCVCRGMKGTAEGQGGEAHGLTAPASELVRNAKSWIKMLIHLGPRFCISSKLPGDADVDGLYSTLREARLQETAARIFIFTVNCGERMAFYHFVSPVFNILPGIWQLP